MDRLFDADGPLPPAEGRPPQQKRSRVLLSCGPCRASKLKCDRGIPCSQCSKKGRIDLCLYAPKPEKRKPAKGMSARLKRLETMVRGMMDAEGNAIPQQSQPLASTVGKTDDNEQSPHVAGQVFQGPKAMTYVGDTHCMAILEDIEDLKDYFVESDEEEDVGSPDGELGDSEFLLFNRGAPRNRAELIAMLPERKVADRLISRYFASLSPSQHIIHRPTFTRAYARFWEDPSGAEIHWVAQLFMLLSLGVHFNRFQAPNELEGDSPLPPADRIKQYRSCAGWALIWGKYMQPTKATIPAFLLYVESDFLLNRATQMNCYVLSGVCVRLMLKMGFHRDPSKLANISPFEAEMRRRMWYMAFQVETIVAFHMGLPAMVQHIESDVQVARNLHDEDFDEDTVELPPARASSDWTSLTYPLNKIAIIKVFGQIAQQAHVLTPPRYSEVLRLDKLLQETWDRLPIFMQVRPLGECVGESPNLLMQRFGLASLFNKSRCVLHRRYLAEAVPKKEHDYSRHQALQGATTLLGFQATIYEACKPGNIMSPTGWFISSLSIHDYLLAAVIIYLVIQNEHYDNPQSEYNWDIGRQPTPSKENLKEMLRRSQEIWADVSTRSTEVRKTADTLGAMLAKLGFSPANSVSATEPSPVPQGSGLESMGSSSMNLSSAGTFAHHPDPLSGLGYGEPGQNTSDNPFTMSQATEAMNSMSFPGMGNGAEIVPDTIGFDPSWMAGDNTDWRYLDISLAHSHTAGANASGPGPQWTERNLFDDVNMSAPDFWGQPNNGQNMHQ